MNLSDSLNQFKIPMLGKFLGGAMQHTKGSFIEGEVYVITAYNPVDSTVQTTGNTTRNRWIDEVAFEVVRNTSWSFKHGHVDLASDLASFESPKHDDHIEALSFDPRVIGATPFSRAWMGIDLANSPDYSASGRYIGANWPELQELPRPARRLSADKILKDYEDYKRQLPHTDFSELEQRAAAAFIHQSPRKETNRERAERDAARRQGKSLANYMYSTGKSEFLNMQAKERRFAAFSTDQYPDLKLQLRPSAEMREKFNALKDDLINWDDEEVSPTDEISDAFLAVQRLMQVPDRLLVEKPTLTADSMHQMQFNCRCVMPELKKGLHNESVRYIESIEDGKPTYSKPFLIQGAEMTTLFEKTMRARLERSMNGVHIHTSAVDDRPLTNTNITSDPFTMSEAPKKANAPDFPLESELVEESTFVHKSATRKTQEIHEENDGTADLRKYRFNPEA